MDMLNKKVNESFVNIGDGNNDALYALKDKLDTLEAKEVDLEKETDKWYNNEASKEFENVLYEDIEKCAKHFFELGLLSQLSWKDIELIATIGMDFMNSEDSDNLNDEEYYTEILNRFKAQKENKYE